MIYLDNSATTSVCEKATEKMKQALEIWGNPSSLHSKGLEAEKLVCEARESVIRSLGVRKTNFDKIIFTSGGTESNNLAVLGTARAKPSNKGKKIITTNSEHSSVLQPFKVLEQEGYNVIYLSTKNGVLDEEEYKKAISQDTVLVSIMLVNNETGAVYDVKKIFDYAKSVNPKITTHCDAVQAYMKLRFTPYEINADLVSVSSHKIHGPKGAGALFVRNEVIKNKRLVPVLYGGGQEDGLRSGTENVPSICGFGGAAEYAFDNLENNIKAMSEVKNYATDKLKNIVRINTPLSEKTAPHIINITFDGIRSETMLHFLSSEGIFVSSGSACSSHSSHKGSYVLKAFGLSDIGSDSSIRISLCETNTKEDIDKLYEALVKAGQTLIRR